MTDWQVTADSRTSNTVTEDHLEALVDLLVGHSGAVSGGGSRVSATFTITDASDGGEAVSRGQQVWHNALVDAGVTVGDVADLTVRATTYDDNS